MLIGLFIFLFISGHMPLGKMTNGILTFSIGLIGFILMMKGVFDCCKHGYTSRKKIKEEFGSYISKEEYIPTIDELEDIVIKKDKAIISNALFIIGMGVYLLIIYSITKVD